MQKYFLIFLFGVFGALQADQLVVSIAPDWNSFQGEARRYTKSPSGKWVQEGKSWPVLFGKNGLAWGRGLHEPQAGLQKREGDGRAPAGRYAIGFAMGYEPALPSGNLGWKYHQVTERDAWIDDPLLPNYNHLYTLKSGERPPIWFERQRKRLGDDAYHWKLLIEHNYHRAIPGAGSAIFFHIRRGEARPTFGCTTMARERMEELLCWLDPKGKVEYVLLPKSEWLRLKTAWGLP
jgi:L,D-peptidoglycan transpeptidase YkuD (ErfK/YbiS/YcfS/YnhG family)